MGNHTTNTELEAGVEGTTSRNVGERFWGHAPQGVVPFDARGGDVRTNATALLPYIDRADSTATERELVREPTAATKLSDSKDVVTLAFGWMSQHADAKLSSLELDLAASDEPTFGERLLSAAFRTALSAATAGASEHLAGLLVGDGSGALRELVKSAMESGFNEAAELGAGALQGSKDPLKAFLNAQKVAVRHQYRRAQTHWLRVGRHQVRTQSQVDAVEAAFTDAAMDQAAEIHYTATRDAWIAYLAQLRFGAVHSKALDENYDVVELGPTTDLTSSHQRARDNSLHPGAHLTATSPDEAGAFLGIATGVLVVEAVLPAIHAIEGTGYYGMIGSPHVTHAFLNGVNGIIRDQFKGRSLSDARIPRVITCRVPGSDTFTLRINEKGIMFDGAKIPWLRARAIASQPWNMTRTDVELEQIGLQLLLADLVPETILKGTSE